jgi:hypothetical protein
MNSLSIWPQLKGVSRRSWPPTGPSSGACRGGLGLQLGPPLDPSDLAQGLGECDRPSLDLLVEFGIGRLDRLGVLDVAGDLCQVRRDHPSLPVVPGELLARSLGERIRRDHQGQGDLLRHLRAEDLASGSSEFLGYFMSRKVIAGNETMKAAGTVIKKLTKWLVEKGHIEDEESIRELVGETARDRPASQKLLDRLDNWLAENASEQYGREVEGHFGIQRVEPGRLWLEPILSGERAIGPIPVPERVTWACRVGWDVDGVVGEMPRLAVGRGLEHLVGGATFAQGRGTLMARPKPSAPRVDHCVPPRPSVRCGKALDVRSRTLSDRLSRAVAAGLLPRAAAVGGEGHGEVGGTPYGI